MPKSKKQQRAVPKAKSATKKKLAQLAELEAARDAHPGEFLEARYQARLRATGSETPEKGEFAQLIERKASELREG